MHPACHQRTCYVEPAGCAAGLHCNQQSPASADTLRRQRGGGGLGRSPVASTAIPASHAMRPTLLLLLACLLSGQALASEYDPHPAEGATSFFEGWMTRFLVAPAEPHAGPAAQGSASDSAATAAAEAPALPASITLIIGGMPNAPPSWNRSLLTMAVQSSRCGGAGGCGLLGEQKNFWRQGRSPTAAPDAESVLEAPSTTSCFHLHIPLQPR